MGRTVSDSETANQFGKYKVIKRISAGGMAEIFKARAEGLGGFQRMFAVKRVHPKHAGNQEFVDMLVEEAKIAGLLSHANIVQIVDLDSTENEPFIAMEYVDGPNLEALITRLAERGVMLPVPHAIFIAVETLKALEYAHDRQIMRGGRPVPLDIIHRDVCPSNVLLSTRGEVKLTDFGIAKARVRSLDTVTGVVKGRFDYLTPEQARSETVDQRTDLFAVGVLLYEMLTCRHPFRQTSEAKTIEAIKKASYIPAVAFNPEVPPAIDRLLAATLTAEPSQRYASATAMKDSLDKFFHEAGYIFSNATLAAYLKGMFPEYAPHTPADTASADEDGETRPFKRGERPVSSIPARVDTEEMPTSERPATRPASRPPDAPMNDRPLTSLDTSMSGVFGPVDDENTIVGSVPGADVNNSDTADTFDALETRIRPSPDAPTRVGALAELGGKTTIQGAPQPTDEPQPVIRQRPPSHSGRSRPRNRKPVHPSVRRAQILSLTIGIFIVVIALLVGFQLGIQAGQSTGSSEYNVSIPSDPRLDVHMPEGSTLSIDGREVPGTSPMTVTLTPDKSHTVRVSRVGHYPVETVIKLRKNDFHLLTVDFETLHSKNP